MKETIALMITSVPLSLIDVSGLSLAPPKNQDVTSMTKLRFSRDVVP